MIESLLGAQLLKLEEGGFFLRCQMANMALQSVLLKRCRRRRRSWLRHQQKAKAVGQVSGGGRGLEGCRFDRF